MFFCKQLVTNAQDGWWSQWPLLDYRALHDTNEVRVLVSNSATNSLSIQWSLSTERLTNLRTEFQQSELWGTAVPKKWRGVNRMYFLILSPVLSGHVDFQPLQFNFLWPKRQVCHEPGTLHITPRMMWGERKELMLMRFGANLSCPKENGHLNRALRNSFIKKGIKNWPVNVLRAKAQCKCIDAP